MLGHIGENGLKNLRKQGILIYGKIGSLKFCEDFVLRKATSSNFKKSIHKTKDKLGYVHSNLWRLA